MEEISLRDLVSPNAFLNCHPPLPPQIKKVLKLKDKLNYFRSQWEKKTYIKIKYNWYR